MSNQHDDSLDLVLERTLDVPRDKVWRAWTEPELLKQWFTPAPWSTAHCEIDLRPGGIFRTVMRGPEGEEFDGTGCFLEVVPNERLVWTSALGPGFRPNPVSEMFFFTLELTLTDEGGSTGYRAVAKHPDAESRNKHDAMGFHDGWGKAVDQLVKLLKRSCRARSGGTN